MIYIRGLTQEPCEVVVRIKLVNGSQVGKRDWSIVVTFKVLAFIIIVKTVYRPIHLEVVKYYLLLLCKSIVQPE